MSEVSYLPLIEDMVWSYSRLGTFSDCPYRFFLRHIRRYKEDEKFYASYGSFIHKLIERYYNGDLPKEDMQMEFLLNFGAAVKGKRPKREIVDKYIAKGSEYLANFEPFPYKCIGIEKKVLFNLDKYKFIGFIDFLGEDDDGNLIVIDNKSRDLKPRSKRKNPTVKDKELDSMLKQLYLYAGAVEQEYGQFPTKLCFNCFKAGVFIEEPFVKEAYDNAVKWALDTIKEIESEEDWHPRYDFFGCNNICGVNKHCEYYEEFQKEFRNSWRNKK